MNANLKAAMPIRCLRDPGCFRRQTLSDAGAGLLYDLTKTLLTPDGSKIHSDFNTLAVRFKYYYTSEVSERSERGEAAERSEALDGVRIGGAPAGFSGAIRLPLCPPLL